MKRLLSFLVCLCAPLPLAAQSVVGTVVEPESGRPVVGAMVRLMSGTEWTGSLFLTAGDGRFRLRAPGPGAYYLRVERIGFAEAVDGPFEVTGMEVLTRNVAVETAPVRLEGLEVTGAARRCDLRSTGGDATHRVWDEARKALASASWTEREAGLRFRVSSRQRRLDPRTEAIIDEDRTVQDLFGGNPVRTLPAEDLARDGYVQEQDGERVFYGPDAEVLLSDAFLSTHCFAVTEGRGEEAHLIGLRFEPVAGRQLADVEGVLWMDRLSSRLERVDFRYTNAGLGPADDRATGQVRFTELADGYWIVKDWYIRAPLLSVRRSFSARQGTVARTMVAALLETGSAVLTATAPGLEWRAHQANGSVEGEVWDSVVGAPLRGAEVRLAGRGWRAVSDRDGGFQLQDVPPGTYRITFTHARLDSLGLEPWWREITVQEGASAFTRLSIPSGWTLLTLRCPRDAGVVVGHVRSTTGEGLPGAAVSVVAGMGEADDAFSGVTDGEGAYSICGLPRSTDVRLQARLGVWASSPVEVSTGTEGYARADLEVALQEGGTTRADVAMGEGAPALVGTVVDASTGAPVEGASVSLLDEAGGVVAKALSGTTGRMILRPPEGGTFRVRTERLGYAVTESAPLELFRGTRRVEVRVSTEAIPLEEVVVAVRGTVRALELNGFYQREAAADGRFIVRGDIERMPVARTSDLLTRVPGVNPVTFNESNTTKRRIQFIRARSVDQRCLPAVYLDGALVREGGTFRGDDPGRWPTEEELVNVDDIEAVELYSSPSSIPVQFQGPGSPCGVVVFWTRRGIGG